MSYKATDWAFAQTKIRGPAKLVLLALAHHHNRETGECRPGERLLAQVTGLHRDTVRKALHKLAASDLLTMTPVRRATDGLIHHTYALHLDKGDRPRNAAKPSAAPTIRLRDGLANAPKPGEKAWPENWRALARNLAGPGPNFRAITGINRDLTIPSPKVLPKASEQRAQQPSYNRPQSTRQRTMAEDLADTSWAT